MDEILPNHKSESIKSAYMRFQFALAFWNITFLWFQYVTFGKVKTLNALFFIRMNRYPIFCLFTKISNVHNKYQMPVFSTMKIIFNTV